MLLCGNTNGDRERGPIPIFCTSTDTCTRTVPYLVHWALILIVINKCLYVYMYMFYVS